MHLFDQNNIKTGICRNDNNTLIFFRENYPFRQIFTENEIADLLYPLCFIIKASEIWIQINISSIQLNYGKHLQKIYIRLLGYSAIVCDG